MKYEREAEEWKAKARRAEQQASTAGDKRTADTWREIARIYWEIAAKREAWEKAWQPHLRDRSDGDGEKSR